MRKNVWFNLSYAIGVAEPVSIFVESYGTSKYTSEQLAEIVRNNFGLKPMQIVEQLDLLRPVYKETAAYGHFGRPGFTWEKTDKASSLK